MLGGFGVGSVWGWVGVGGGGLVDGRTAPSSSAARRCTGERRRKETTQFFFLHSLDIFAVNSRKVVLLSKPGGAEEILPHHVRICYNPF